MENAKIQKFKYDILGEIREIVKELEPIFSVFVIRKSVEIERCFHKRHLTICVNNNCVSRFSNESGSLAEQAE